MATNDSRLTPSPAANSAAVWRDGPSLVMRRDAELPYRCVTTGEAAEGPADEVTVASLEGAQAGMMFGALGAILAALAARWFGNQVTIRVPQSDFARTRRFWTRVVGIVLCVGGLVGLAVVIPLAAPKSSLLLYGGGGSVLAALLGVALWMDSLQPVTLVKMDGDHIWLGGVTESYLAPLPEWPKPPAA